MAPNRAMRAVLTGTCFALGLAAVGLAGIGQAGCSPCNFRGQEPERFEGGRVLASGTTYETGAMDELLLPFPAGQTYDLVHGLGVTPTSIQGYVSFAPQLTEDGDPLDLNQPNNLAETAGNQLVIERWDDEIVRVRNDTCAPFYLRVVLVADTAENSSGLAGAGGT
jgi:hypothetical protein